MCGASLLLFLAFAGQAADGDTLDGEWIAIRVERDGKAEGDVVFHKVVIKNGSFVEYERAGKVIGEGMMRVGQGNKHVDFVHNDGEVVEGIYRLRGDTFEICRGDPRPTEFATKMNDGRQLVQLSRKKRG